MRPLAVVLAALLIACSSTTETAPEATPQAAPPARGIEHCLVDGRSLEFEWAVKERMQSALEVPVSLEPGVARINQDSEIRYSYAAEYLMTIFWPNGKVGPIREYWSGWVFATNCAALLSTPP